MEQVCAVGAESGGGHAMSCMEVWGGNRAFEDAVSTPGIDCWVHSRPHAGNERGGDIHYVSMCSAGKIARFVVADVAGHGDEVSSFARTLRNLMRKHINTLDQTRFARVLNEEMLGEASAEANGRFATALLVTYFTPTDQLIVCNAGHPRPLWYRADAGAWQVLDERAAGRAEAVGNVPMGIIEPTAYAQFGVSLARGDLVLLYTDSLIEARGTDGKMLGESGLLEMVRGIDVHAPARLVPELLARVEAYRGGAAADDDVTAMLLHHNAADPPRYSLLERVESLGRAVGLVG